MFPEYDGYQNPLLDVVMVLVVFGAFFLFCVGALVVFVPGSVGNSVCSCPCHSDHSIPSSQTPVPKPWT